MVNNRRAMEGSSTKNRAMGHVQALRQRFPGMAQARILA
jgi:hypothetical protein